MTESAVHPFDGLLDLEAGFNVRDFGGCPTQDGRRVRRGMLYRSGTMAMLTEQDADRMRALGIRAICDFRSIRERDEEPTRWHEPERTFYWGAEYSHRTTAIMDVLGGGAASAEALRETIIGLYRRMAVDHGPSFRAMFRHLAEGLTPMLINCAAGKDRTGVGAALILSALGVARADVEKDYLRTNDQMDWALVRSRAGELVQQYMTTDPEVVRPFLYVEPAYLDAFFDEVDRAHGGIHAYLSSLGMDEAGIAALHDHLVEA